VVRPTLLEAHSLLLRRLGARRALTWLEEVLPSVFVADPNPDDFDAAVERLRSFPDQSLSIFDAVLAVVSERTGVPVWTFDHHFDVMRVPVWR